MRRRPDPPGQQPSQLGIRIAWWVAFIATLALVFAIAQAQQAQALSTAPALPLAVGVDEEGLEFEEEEEEEEEEEGWEAEEECEVAGEDEEPVCDEGEWEVAASGAPPECLLRSAEATVLAVPGRDVLRLAIQYTARAPATVRVSLRLHGGRGALNFGEHRGRFARQGTFRVNERLTEAQLRRVVAARDFTVGLQAVGTPRACHRYFDQKLSEKRAAGGTLSWRETAARAAARARR